MKNSFGENGSKVNEDFPISETEYFFYMNNLRSPGFVDVLDYLKSRGFTD